MEPTGNLKKALKFYRKLIIKSLASANRHTHTDVLSEAASILGDTFLDDLRYKKGLSTPLEFLQHIIAGYMKEEEKKISSFCQTLRHRLRLGIVADLIESFPDLRVCNRHWRLLSLLSQIRPLQITLRLLGEHMQLKDDTIRSCRQHNLKRQDKVKAILFHGLWRLQYTSLAHEAIRLVDLTVERYQDARLTRYLRGLLDELRAHIDAGKWMDGGTQIHKHSEKGTPDTEQTGDDTDSDHDDSSGDDESEEEYIPDDECEEDNDDESGDTDGESDEASSTDGESDEASSTDGESDEASSTDGESDEASSTDGESDEASSSDDDIDEDSDNADSSKAHDSENEEDENTSSSRYDQSKTEQGASASPLKNESRNKKGKIKKTPDVKQLTDKVDQIAASVRKINAFYSKYDMERKAG
ncbi:Hypp4034 [Branchiostoma lanceolatum]|uniref:Hypp4034 protein n=1 Tax=Branchiostoma lanceolatum TaxID=7740 RepID=A0A8K0EZJ3_BRALA|nr:Hypp4034 [Branchiostoma lanceolatum]